MDHISLNISQINVSDELRELIKTVINDDVIAFIGAGVSKALGYRTWKEGLYSNETSRPGLLKVADITQQKIEDHKISPTDYPAIIDLCRSKLDEDTYLQFLELEYGEKKEIDQHLNTIMLWQINFKHIITTNFDRSLYDGGIFNGFAETLTFPHEDISLKENIRSLVYLHGRAFLIEEDTEGLPYFLKNIVFGRESYSKAYITKKEIENFIYEQVKKFSIIFIGFSMEDEEFKELFKKTIEAKKAHDVDLLERTGNYTKTDIFIIAEEAELEEFVFDKPKSKKEKKIEVLKRLDLKIISYVKIDEIYKGLSHLLNFIKNEAPILKRKPIERKFARNLSEASKKE